MFKTRSITVELFLILAATLHLAASCSSEPKQPATDPGQNLSKTGAHDPGAVAEPPEQMTFEGPGALLGRQVGDWRISSAPRYFGPDNLYDLINGGAEIYVEFGLTKMVTVDYKAPDRKTQTVTVEVYDMGTPNGAFGRVARFLDGLVDPSGAGDGLPADLAELGSTVPSDG